MSTAGVLLLTAAFVLAVGVAAAVTDRRSRGLGAAIVAVLLVVVAPAVSTFPTPMETWVGSAAAPFVGAVALLVVAPIGRPALISIIGATLAGPGRVLLTDPFLDPSCTEGCRPNPLGLASWPAAADGLRTVGTVLIVLGAALLAWQVRQRVPHALAAGAAGVTALGTPALLPILIVVGPLAVATVTAIEVRNGLVARGRVEDLVRALGSEPGDLAGLLRDRWADPDVWVYHRISAGGFADTAGRPEPADTGSRRVTEVVANGVVVTRIHHDIDRADAAAVGEALDQRARLALENDRLAADVAARAEVLRAARVRLVQAGDAARRALERDLHDSAQQHVLALGLELQVAAASPALDAAGRMVLDECRAETQQALARLREISHGIYPADLEAGGLGHALRELALRSDVPVQLSGLPEPDPPGDAARAAYAVVEDAVGQADGTLHVCLRRTTDRLGLEIRGVRRRPRQSIVDRVAAFGGTLREGPASWEVELPCASS